MASVVLEIERKYLLKYKAALEAKDKKLEKLTFEVNELKQNVEIQTSEWKGIETRLRDLEKEQQKQLGEFKSTTNALHQDLLEKIQARLLKVEKEMQRLGRPWWQELFGHLRPRPELSRKNGMVLLGALAFLQSRLPLRLYRIQHRSKNRPPGWSNNHLSRSTPQEHRSLSQQHLMLRPHSRTPQVLKGRPLRE